MGNCNLYACQYASNDFLRGGGDGYEVFVEARNAYDFGAALDEAVQAYIAANAPASPQLEGRITQNEGAAPAMEAAEAPATLPASGGVISLLPAMILSLAGISLTGAGLWLRRKK